MKTKEEKFKLLAQLDGILVPKYEVKRCFNKMGGEFRWIEKDGIKITSEEFICDFGRGILCDAEYIKSKVDTSLPDYFTYDKVIPLIQKQPRNILTRIVLSMKGQNDVSRMVDWLLFSPEELADILIKVIKTENEK